MEIRMARIRLDIPEDLDFSIQVRVRVGDINYGNHLGNDALLALLHEARLRFLAARGCSETDICGCGLIMADAALVYRAQAFLGDNLTISVGVADFTGSGCDIVYRVVRAADAALIALAKTGIVLFDYERGKLVRMTDAVRQTLSRFSDE